MHRPVPMTLVPTITKSPSLPRQPPPPYPASSHPPAVPLFTSLPSPVTQIGTLQRPQHKPPKTTKSLYIVSYAHSIQIGISHYYQTEKNPPAPYPSYPTRPLWYQIISSQCTFLPSLHQNIFSVPQLFSLSLFPTKHAGSILHHIAVTCSSPTLLPNPPPYLSLQKHSNSDRNSHPTAFSGTPLA